MQIERVPSGWSYGPAKGGKWAVYKPDGSLYYEYGDRSLAIKTACTWGPEREGDAEHVKRLERMADAKKSVGAKLKKIRTDRGYSQEEAGAKVDVAKTTWYKYESGKKDPDPAFYYALHDVFRVDLNWLLAGEGKE